MPRPGTIEHAKELYDLSEYINDESVKLGTLREALTSAEKAKHHDLIVILKSKIEYIEKSLLNKNK